MRGPATSADAEPDEGEVIESRELGTIQLGRRIGQGGMGRVYEACRPNLPDAMFAVKFLEPSLLRDALALERFESEARRLAELRHRNIVRVLGYGRTAFGPCILMELLRGRPLSKFLKGLNGARLDRGLACSVIVEVLEGLQRVHEKGLVHRDIKGDNIFLETGDGDVVVKVIDFGIVKENVGTVTTAEVTGGFFVGTPSAAAPEQLMGRAIGSWTDIYQVGVLAYVLLAGRHPFEEAARAGSTAMVRAQVLEAVPPLSNFAPDLPAEIVATVMTMLQKDPAHRVLTGRDGRPDGSAKTFRTPFRNLVREIERQQLAQDGQHTTAQNRLLELVQQSAETAWPTLANPQLPVAGPPGAPPFGGTAPLRTMTRMGDGPAPFAQAAGAAHVAAPAPVPLGPSAATPDGLGPSAPAFHGAGVHTSYGSTTAPTASSRSPSAAPTARSSRAPAITAAIVLPVCMALGSASVWLLTRRHAGQHSAAAETSAAATAQAAAPAAPSSGPAAASDPPPAPPAAAPLAPEAPSAASATPTTPPQPSPSVATTASTGAGRAKAPAKASPAASASDPALWGLGVFK